MTELLGLELAGLALKVGGGCGYLPRSWVLWRKEFTLWS
jgi:hypothetical protein